MSYVPEIAFVLGGAGVFYLGLRVWRRYRFVTGTPLSPVGSLRPGLVRARGRASGDDRLTSPLTRVPCFYYDVDVRRPSADGARGRWETVAGEKDARPFYLDDGTGRVRVDPKGAEWRVTQTFRAAMSSSGIANRFVEPSLGVAGPSDEELSAYIPNYFSRLRAGVGAADAPAAIRQGAGRVLGAAEWFESKGVSVSVSGGGFKMEVGGHTYHFTERCLPVDRECEVFGTCVENPAPKNDRDRDLVRQGEEEATFLIDSSGEEAGTDLRRRALLMLLVGAALAIIGVYFVLHDARVL